MAGPGVSKNSIRGPEIHAEKLKSERSIMKRDHAVEEKEAVTSNGQRAARCTCDRLPPVPKRTDPPPMQYPPYQDDYVKYNAKHIAALANYREPRCQVVDSRDGHVMDVVKSGLVPVFKEKQSYGRLPGYLKKGNQILYRDQQQRDQEIKQDPPPQPQPETNTRKSRSNTARPPVSKEIEALQKRWIELEERLRLISFSRPDKREAIEDELRGIEVRLRMAISR